MLDSLFRRNANEARRGFLRKRSIKRQSKKWHKRARTRLRGETLERRDLLAGNLAVDVVQGTQAFVRLTPPSGQEVHIRGNNTSDTARLLAFFSSPDGAATVTTINGSLTVVDDTATGEGRVIAGTFTLDEFAAGDGVAIVAANADVQFGDDVGIQISDADGAFALLSSGLAGRLAAEDASDTDDITVVGLLGLEFDSPFGISYEVNTTGAAVNVTVPTASGDQNISFDNSVEQVTGPAEFHVDGTAGSIVAAEGVFTITEDVSGTLAIAAADVGVTLSTGDVRVASMASATAAFTLGVDTETSTPTFALVQNSFTVSGFQLLPRGTITNLDASNAGAGAQVLPKANIGPLSLSFVNMTLPTLTLAGDELNVGAGVFAKEGTLTFKKDGDTTSDASAKPITVKASKPEGEFKLRGFVDPSSEIIETFLFPGAFSLGAASVTIEVPEILKANATGVTIAYDPLAGLDQELFSASSVNVEIPKLDITGQFLPTANNNAVTVFGDGFAFGRGTVQVSNLDIIVSDLITISDPFVRLTDFAVDVFDGITLGEFAVGANKIQLKNGSSDAWSLTGDNVTAAVSFNDSFGVKDVKFTVNKLEGKLGSFLSVSTTDTTFVPTATGDDELLRIAGSLSASIKVRSLDLSGTVSTFAIEGDGDFKTLPGFGASFGLGVTRAADILFPEFIPLQIDEIGVSWPNFAKNPENFQLIFSGGVSGKLPAGIAELSGSITGLVIEPQRLFDGEFPITSVDDITVSAKGDFFGVKLEGGLFGGVVKIDDEGAITTGPTFADSFFYMGLSGQFEFPNVGTTGLRIAFSEVGPLGVYFSAGVPITVDPVFTGLTLNNFRGGVTFNAIPLIPPTTPTDLLSSRFKPTLNLDFDTWSKRTRQQVANIVSGEGGFLFDFKEDVSGTITELNNRSISADGSLQQAFANNGYSVGTAFKRPTVKVLEFNKLWHVQFGANEYFIEKKGELSSTKLRVSSATFTLNAALTTELGEGGAASQTLVDAFRAQGIDLTTSAIVEVVKRDDTSNAPTKWRVTQSGHEYTITPKNGKAPGNDIDALLAVNGDTGTFDDLMIPSVRIEAGATIYSTFITQSAFQADVDIAMTTEGGIIFNGKFILGEKFSADTTMFADLSLIRPDSINPPQFTMVADFPGASSGLPRVARVLGQATWEFLDINGNLVNPIYRNDDIASFRFSLLGRGEIQATDLAKVVIGGDAAAGSSGGFAQLELLVGAGPNGSDEIELGVSGSLGIQGIIPAEDLVSGAGRLILRVPDDFAPDEFELFGALKLDFDTNSPGLSWLEDAGLAADAEILLGINATPDVQELELALPGRALETFFLEPLTFAFEMQGSLTMQQDVLGFGANLMMHGVFGAHVRVDTKDNDDPLDDSLDFELFVSALLEADANVPGANLNLFTMDALGVFVVRNVNPLTIPSMAGKLDLVGTAGIPHVFEISTGTPAALQFNTTGVDQEYEVPERLRDRLNIMQARREQIDPADVVLPATTVQGGTIITIPGTPPPMIDGQTFVSGPYFFINIGGDPLDESDDATVSFLNAFELQGDFRLLAAATGGFEMIVNARVGTAVAGLDDLIQLNQNAQGLFRVSQKGIVGALTLDADIDLGGLVQIDGDVFLGINTTASNEIVTVIDTGGGQSQRILGKESAEVLITGNADIGAFELDGEFRILASDGELQFSIDAGLEFFDIAELRIQQSAVIETGVDIGLQMNAPLNEGQRFSFGQAGIFEASGVLRMELDTLNNVARIRIDDLDMELLGVIDLDGDAVVRAFREFETGASVLRMSGNLEADFFGVADVRASGFYDSRGFVDIDLNGSIRLGSSSFGIRGSGNFFIRRDESIPLDFGGSGEVRVKAFGVSVGGADLEVDYDPASGKIEVESEVSVGVGPFSVSKSVDFTIGFLKLGSELFPNLAEKDGSGGLTLNVGDRGGQRNVEADAINEAYTITSLGPGSERGQKVRVRAFGTKQVFDDITSITGDFGDGNDQFRVLEGFGQFTPIAITVDGGEGRDRFFNESALPVRFTGGPGNDLLAGGSGVDELFGGDGDDELIGDAGDDLIRGGAGNDQIVWELGHGTDDAMGDAGIDRLVAITGFSSEQIEIDRVGSNAVVDIQNGVFHTLRMDTEEVEVRSGGGADTVTLTTAAITGLNAVRLSLGSLEGAITQTGGSVDVSTFDDDAADRVIVQGTDSDETFDIDTTSGLVRVTRNGSFELLIGDETRGVDVLQLNANGGSDRLTLAGPFDGSSAGERLRIELFGGADNDEFSMPIGGASFDGQGGSDTALFTVVDGSLTDVMLTNNSASNAERRSVYTGLVEVAGLDINTSATATVQSTHAGRSIVRQEAGTLEVRTTGGSLDIELDGDASRSIDVTVISTTADLTVTGGTSSETVAIGTGLVSRIGGSVTSTNLDSLNFSTALDGRPQDIVIGESSLSGVGAGGPLNHSQVTNLGLTLGLGDDVVDVTLSPASVTLDTGDGNDLVNTTLNSSPAAIELIDPVGTALTTLNVEHQTLNNANATQAANWLFNEHLLTGDDVRVLDITPDAKVQATLGEADGDTLQILRVLHDTEFFLRGEDNTVTIGGELGLLQRSLDDIDEPLRLMAETTSNTLVFNDIFGPLNLGAPRPRSFVAGTVTGFEQNGPIKFDLPSFDDVVINLGIANDELLATDIPSLTQINSGAGDDLLRVGGTLGSLVVSGEDDNDQLQLLAGTGSVSFLGGAGTDAATSDRSDSAVDVSGSLVTAGNVTTVSLDGVADISFTAPSDVEELRVQLGAGNDTFEIDNSGFDATFDLFGGPGDDNITITQAVGAPGSHRVDGEGGVDQVTVIIAGDPVADQFLPVAPTVEELIVDNQTNSNAVSWISNGTVLSGNDLTVIDTAGADRVSILGGTSGADMLEVTSTTVTADVEATVHEDNIELFEGLSVLDFNSRENDFELEAQVDGLMGARLVASDTDGQFIATAGDQPGFAVFRRDGQNLEFLTRVTSPELFDVQRIAVSPNGRHLFVDAVDTDDVGRILNFQIDTATRRPSLIQTLPFSAGELLVSPDSRNLVDVGATSVNNYSIDSTTGVLTHEQFLYDGDFDFTVFARSAAFSEDGSRLFVARTRFDGDSIAIFDRNTTTGELTRITTAPETGSGLFFSLNTHTEVVDDGRTLITWSGTDASLQPSGRLAFYELAPEFGGVPVRELYRTFQVDGAANPNGSNQRSGFKQFDYEDGLLVTLEDNGQTLVSLQQQVDGDFNRIATLDLQGGGLPFGVVELSASPATASGRWIGMVSRGTNGSTSSVAWVRQNANGTFGGLNVDTGSSSERYGSQIAHIPDPAGQTDGYFITTQDGEISYSGTTFDIVQSAAVDLSSATVIAPIASSLHIVGANFEVRDIAVNPQSDNIDWNGNQNKASVWSLESEGNTNRLRADTFIRNDMNDTTSLTMTRTGTKDITGPTQVRELKFTPDGLSTFITSDFEQPGTNVPDGMVRARIDALTEAEVGNVGTTAHTTFSPLNNFQNFGSSISFGNGLAYLSRRNRNGLVIRELPTTGALGNGVGFGSNAFTIGSDAVIAGAADPNQFYLANSDDQLIAFRYSDNGPVQVRRTLTDGSDGVEGLGSVDSLAHSGDVLLVTSVDDDSVTLFRIDADGRPSFESQIIDDDTRNLLDPGGITITPEAVYVTSTGEDALTLIPFDGSNLGEPSSVRQGDTFTATISGFMAMAASLDGRYLFGVSGAEDALLAFDRQTGETSGVRQGSGTQGLTGVSDVAVSPDGRYVVATSVFDGVITAFDFDGNGDLQFVSRYEGSESVAARSVQFVSNDEVIVAGGDGLRRFRILRHAIIPQGTTPTDVPVANPTLIELLDDQLVVGSETDGTVSLITFTSESQPTAIFDNKDVAVDLSNGIKTGIELGDLDGDGDLDAFIPVLTIGNGSHQVLINQGLAQGGISETFLPSGQDLGHDTSRAATLGDVDGDGDLDVVLANEEFGGSDPANLVLINQGGVQGGTPATFLHGQSFGDSESLDVALADVDGDGDLDAMFANREQHNRLWLNQGGLQGGTAGMFVDSVQLLGDEFSVAVNFGDLDGDGDVDAIIANRFNSHQVLINQGGDQGGTLGEFVDSGQVLSSGISPIRPPEECFADGEGEGGDGGTGGESCGGFPIFYDAVDAELADLDGDGDLDLFVVSDNFDPSSVWLNQSGLQGGAAGEFVFLDQPFAETSSNAVTLADFDNDGDLDAYEANGSSADRVWINQGGRQGGVGGLFVDSGQTPGGNTDAVAAEDFDGDGDVDVIQVLDNGNSPDQARILFNRNGPVDVQVDEVASGLGSVSGVARFEGNLFVTDRDGTLHVLRRADASSQFELTQSIAGGQNGIPSMLGASDVAVSQDGRFVFVSVPDRDAVLVFARDAEGELLFAQLVRDGRSGVSGLTQPTDLLVEGDTLIVSTAAGRGATTGGFTFFDITTDPLPDPQRLVTAFDTVESVKLTTREGDDRVRLLQAPSGDVQQTSIVTGGGSDQVTVFDIAPAQTTQLDLGDGNDSLTIAHSSSGTTDINAGLGEDLIRVAMVGDGSQTLIGLDDGTDGDIAVVSSVGIPATATVNVNGNQAVGTPTVFDALVIETGDGAVSTTPPTGSAGTVNEVGQGDIVFAGFNNQTADVQQLFIEATPQPQITFDPTSISEGDGVTISVVDAAGGGNLTYEWDLDGDGVFFDGSGNSLPLTWTQLQSFGIDDDGTHPIAVRATSTGQSIPSLPAFQFTTISVASLIINNVAPAIVLQSPTIAHLNGEHTITFTATDPGNDRVGQWMIDWGDGVSQSFGSQTTQAAHTYTQLGDFTLTVTAVDEDGPTLVNQAVGVRPGDETVSAGGSYRINEGDTLLLSASAFGSPLRFEWDLGLPGLSFTSTSPDLELSWAMLEAANNSLDGDVGLSVSLDVIYEFNSTAFIATDVGTLDIINVAPTGTLTANVTALNEGSTSGDLQVSVLNVSDPSTVDTARGFTVSYDFDNDGTFDLENQDPATVVDVPNALFSDNGIIAIRARLFDKPASSPDDLQSRDLFTTVVVHDVMPTLTLTPDVTTLDEGDTLTLDVSAFDPGGDPILKWLVDWGDGSPLSMQSVVTPQFTHTYADGTSDYNVSVTARTDAGDVAESFVVTVNDVAPVAMLSTASATVAEGSVDAPFTMNVAFTDPGNDPVSRYTVDWGDGTIEDIVGTAASAAHIYRDEGSYEVTLTQLVNGDGTFVNPSNTLSVTVTDVGPTIVDAMFDVPATGQEGAALTLTATAFGSQSGDDPLTFTWTIERPDNSTFDLGGSGVPFLPDTAEGLNVNVAFDNSVKFTPTDNGTFNVTLTVIDDDGTMASRAATINVRNVKPTLNAFVVASTANEGQPLQFTASATDPAGVNDPLTFTWTITNVLTRSTTMLDGPDVRFTPDGGNYGVALKVTDGDGGTATAATQLQAISLPPLLQAASVQIPTTANEAETVSLSAAATDNDGSTDGLSFVWRIEAPNRKVTRVAGAQASFTFLDDGDYKVSVAVTDNDGKTTVSPVQTVTVANLAPTIASANAPATGTEGVALNFVGAATDPAGSRDPLSFIWTVTHPDDSTTEVGGRDANFIPPDDGTYTVSLTVDDEEGGVATVEVGSIVVANADPTLSAIVTPTGPIDEGQSATLSVNADDVAGDLDGLAFAWTITTPAGADIGLTGPAIDFTPAEDGTYNATVVVTDGDGGSAIQTAQFTGNNVAPTIRAFEVPSLVFAGQQITLTADATDPGQANDPLIFTWAVTDTVTSDVMTLTGGQVSFAAGSDDYHVTLTVADDDGGEVAQSATIRVVEVNVPTSGVEGGLLTFSAATSDNDAFSFDWAITGGVNTVSNGSDVEFTPEDDGLVQVRVTVADGNGQTITSDLNSINISNLDPTLRPIRKPTVTISSGKVLTLSVLADDAPGDIADLQATWTLTSPTGQTLQRTGSLVKFPTAAVGLYQASVVVTDGDGGSTTGTTQVTTKAAVRFLPLVGNFIARAFGNIITPSEVDEFSLDLQQGPPQGIYTIGINGENGLDPAAIEIIDSTGNPIVTHAFVTNAGDGSQSVIVVTLPPGDYTVRVSAEGNTTGSYSLDVRMPGALDGEGQVTQRTLQLAEAAMLQRHFGFNTIALELFSQRLGIDLSVDQFRSEFDANLNGEIGPLDIEAIKQNYGDGSSTRAIATLTPIGGGPGETIPAESEGPATFNVSDLSFSVFQNPANRLDVNADGTVSPLDALVVINLLNDIGPTSINRLAGTIAEGESASEPIIAAAFYDTNGDDEISPIDVLLVINKLISAEGESSIDAAIALLPQNAPAPPIAKSRHDETNARDHGVAADDVERLLPALSQIHSATAEGQHGMAIRAFAFTESKDVNLEEVLAELTGEASVKV
ncbi:MAG: beta-propeller fold lactonase family protein [Planctomycetaceae bacterium]|nr:beta-propeller fold lactonase family protein [Planctomycetaceae bacterium]